MGGTNSKSNDELVDALVNSNSIKDKSIEQVFRLVDRGRFFPAEYLNEAYREQPFKIPDSAADDWSPGRLHISAPGMYAAVLDALQLRQGQSFLNIGSGSGWLNTAVGFMIGSDGVNHGIEIHENLVKYSIERRYETLNTPELASFSFAVPIFIHGNGLAQQIPAGLPRYDRIYCGASVIGTKSIDRLVRLLEIRGRLVAPVNGGLMCYHRTGEKRYTAQRLMSCQFAELIRPTKTDKRNILPKIHKPDTLQRLCRNYIRGSIRDDIWRKEPPKMRSICCKDRLDNLNASHVVYFHPGEAQGEARFNFINGAPNFHNFARVRLVIPNAEDPGNWPMEDMVMQREDEDNTRLQVHDLKDEDDDDDDENQQIVQPAPPRAMIPRIRRRQVNMMEFGDRRIHGFVGMDPEMQQLIEQHQFQQQHFLGFVPAVEREQQRIIEDNLPPFRDEGPNVAESEDDDGDDEDQVDEVIHDEEQASSSDGQDNERNRNNVEDHENDAEIEEMMRPHRPLPLESPPPDELDEREQRFREHRRVSRQRMQVMIANRRRQRGDSDSSDEDEQPTIPRGQLNENKRRRMEETRVESKDDRQIRIQRETIGMFCDLFNKRLNSLPVPSHMLAFLKHANGYV